MESLSVKLKNEVETTLADGKRDREREKEEMNNLSEKLKKDRDLDVRGKETFMAQLRNEREEHDIKYSALMESTEKKLNSSLENAASKTQTAKDDLSKFIKSQMDAIAEEKKEEKEQREKRSKNEKKEREERTEKEKKVLYIYIYLY